MPASRKRLFHINRYQVRVLALVLAPPVLIIVALSLLSNAFFDQLITAIEDGTTTTMVQFLTQWKYNVFLVLWALLTAVVLVTYLVSKNLLGAFTRIFRELDEVISGERSTPLRARPRDDLANELLKRVNTIASRTSHEAG